MSPCGVTLGRHILEQERRSPEFAGQLSILVNQIALAAKILTREISRAALVGKLGLDRALTSVEAAAQAVAHAGKVGVVGFCWGGTVAYLAAIRLALGTGPADAEERYQNRGATRLHRHP